MVCKAQGSTPAAANAGAYGIYGGGMRRVAEVLFGCVVGIAVAWLLSRLWPLPEAGHSKASSGG